MIALVQRVSRSSVSVDGDEIARIGRGFTILLGVLKEDSESDINKLVPKLVHLRIFADEAGKMNRSILDVGGEALVVSQFTLAGSVKKGRRPSFDDAMPPKEAKRLYERFCETLETYVPVRTGEFGTMMDVEIHNDGPVTFIVDSKAL
ncbi:D-aminoacyl-tRNA deacylase [Hydrogenimonas urashimensis]|uniref:D-aminoacyl-tRNA deacylase n=1 Tax=Hydrogenimonas urashimensis TaxID=2740515 RepID=UPI001914EBD7|nr:D-aminoacyl-tRNA deacylase [Hydrogenimonas urashimensis]